MKIGELSRRTGASVRALRYYEEQGLLAPERLPSGYRDYDERSVATVARVRVLLSAGLNTAAIAEILPNVTDDSVVLTGRCPELREGLAVERARITERIEGLLAARDILDSLIGRPLVVSRTPSPRSAASGGTAAPASRAAVPPARRSSAPELPRGSRSAS
jgi:DNA-binding transcriptional MerR regulator